MPRSVTPDPSQPTPRKAVARKRAVRTKKEELPLEVDFTEAKLKVLEPPLSPTPPPNPPAQPPAEVPPLPFARSTKFVFWGGVGLILAGALGTTIDHLRQQDQQLKETSAKLEVAQNSQLETLAILAQEAAKSARPGAASTKSNALELELSRQLEAIPPHESSFAARAIVHRALASIAWAHGDTLSALTHSRKTVEFTAPQGTTISLVEDELFQAGILARETEFPALAASIETHLAGLPDSPEKSAASFRLASLQAQAATRAASEAITDDQIRRELSKAKLKAKGVALSDQLRSEMNGEYQRREKMQQDATSQNDPSKMALAMKEKETYDEKFRTELKRREDDLRQQSQAAMQSDPAVGEAQQKATDLWKKVLASAQARNISAELTEARCGLASALLGQDNLAEAEAVMNDRPAETPEDTISQKVRVRLVLGKLSLRKAAVLSKEQAAPIQQAGITSLRDALAMLENQSTDDFRAKEVAGQLKAVLAGLLNAAGQKDASAVAVNESNVLLSAAASDGSWMEISHRAKSRINQCRDLLRQSTAPQAANGLSQARELEAALNSWHLELLKEAPAQEAIQSAKDAAKKIIDAAPDTYSWSALIPF